MKKYFIIIFSSLLLSSALDAKKTKKPVKKPVSAIKMPLDKKVEDLKPEFDNKYGFEIRASTSSGLRGVMDITKNLELLVSFSYFYDVFRSNYQIFYGGSGIRYNIHKNESGSSWYISPLLNVGWYNNAQQGDSIVISLNPVMGYIWRWDVFNLSLDVGSDVIYAFSKSKPAFMPTAGLGVGWSF